MAVKTTIPADALHTGRNVKVWAEGTTMFLAVDISPDTIKAAPMSKGTPQKPGTNKSIASTLGNQSLPSQPAIRFGVNVYTPPV